MEINTAGGKSEKINELKNIPEKILWNPMKWGKVMKNRKEILRDTDNRDHRLREISNLCVPEEGW